MDIVLASHNTDKIAEFQEIFKGTDINIVPLDDPEIMSQVVEDGKTYEANAQIKARALWERIGGWVLADDSGLSCDKLDGYPGIYSSRFAGEEANYRTKSEHLWAMLEPFPEEEWTASFICALCLISPLGGMTFYRGEVKGRIIPEQRGENGFGYDPIFYLPERGKTTAEIPPEEKHEISHRGIAARKMLDALLKANIATPREFS